MVELECGGSAWKIDVCFLSVFSQTWNATGKFLPGTGVQKQLILVLSCDLPRLNNCLLFSRVCVCLQMQKREGVSSFKQTFCLKLRVESIPCCLLL